MRINNNLMAMNTHRQLGMANAGGAKSMEKLSSGMRINRAGDDAAGLAISEKMRGQIRGLTQASSNAQDGISLIQTAEGALNETHAILQRMRELSVQAASDTNVEADRGEIQKEMNQLTSEINRIGNTTEFNTMKLVDGTRANDYNVTESKVAELVEGTGGDVTVASSVGMTLAGGTDAAWVSSIKGGITLADDPSAAGDAIKWSGVDTSTATDNEVKLTKTAEGGLTIDLKATDGTDTRAHSITIDKDTLTSGAKDGVYKVEFHGVSFDLDIAEFEDVKGDGSGTVTLDMSKSKGEAASTDTTGNYGLKSDFATNSADFTEFTIDGTNSALAGMESLEIGMNAAGTDITIKGYGSDGTTALLETTVTLDTAVGEGDEFAYNENGISFKFEGVDSDGAGDVSFTTNKLDIKDLSASTKEVTVENKELEKDNSLEFQVGANENQAMSLDIGDMRAAALGISSAAGGAGYAGATEVTDGTDNEAVEYALDVSSHDAAAKSVTTINDAIERVSSERSKLGAVQNRLEHTIKNLDTSSENLQASESRIRDVDMAKEMMEQTKQNILSQASTAMLAQANSAPEGVLQLLR